MIILVSCKNDGFGGRRHTKPEDGPKKDVAQTPTIKPNVNVYIENSGSMDGYVKGVTEFEQSVYNYLSDIKIANVVDSLNLNYINSEVLPYKPKDKKLSDELDVLKDFIEKLEPSVFKQRGGKRSKSDISDVIKDVLDNTKENNISILVTDGVFSPGSGKDADEYLVNQQIGIKNSFSGFLNQHKDAAVIVYQLYSKFDGNFYDKANRPIYYKGRLPFYIYIIGNSQNLKLLSQAVPESDFKGDSVKHTFSIIANNNNVKYSINPSIGKFKKSKTDTKKTIEDLEKDSRTGKVKFAVNVDFSNLLLNDEYLLNSNNYENSSKYQLEIKPATVKGNGYTHTLNFNSDKVYKGTIIVKLKAVPCKWVDDSNDDEGIRPTEGKTYGIKYQLGGIFDAFTFNNKYYTEIEINIK